MPKTGETAEQRRKRIDKKVTAWNESTSLRYSPISGMPEWVKNSSTKASIARKRVAYGDYSSKLGIYQKKK